MGSPRLVQVGSPCLLFINRLRPMRCFNFKSGRVAPGPFRQKVLKVRLSRDSHKLGRRVSRRPFCAFVARPGRRCVRSRSVLIFRVPPNLAQNSKFLYEAQREDFEFLRVLVQKSDSILDKVSFARLVAAFEKLIIRFEKKELGHFLQKSLHWNAKFNICQKGFSRQRFSLFMLWDPRNKILDYQLQSQIFDHWRARQLHLKRPLLRCFWRIVHSPFSGFGKQNPKKIAFEPRKNKKKKTRIGSRCLRGLAMIDRLESLNREMRMMQHLIRMVTLREKLKLRYELLNLWALRADLQVN